MTNALTSRFEAERPSLFALAYRMLGSAAGAEDILQEAYLRCRSVRPGELRSPRAYFTTVVSRLCLDHLKSAAAQREAYVGPWLPEPLLSEGAPPAGDASDRVGMAESVTMAFLLLLESLTPVERGVFLLHEVFDYSFAEVADVLGKSEAACRQSFHRAKEHVRERRPRFSASREEQEKLMLSFVQACVSGDVAALSQALSEDVTAWTDSGGKASAARKPVHGRDAVARFLMGLTRKMGASMRGALGWANGAPTLIVTCEGKVVSLFLVEGSEGQIRAVRIVRNPDKLARLSSMASPHEAR